MVVNGTPSRDKGDDFVSETEVGTYHEPSQVTACHFDLATFRQHQGATAMSTGWWGDYPIQADFEGNPETVAVARVAASEKAAIGRHR